MALKKKFSLVFASAAAVSFIAIMLYSGSLSTQQLVADHQVVQRVRELQKLMQDTRLGDGVKSKVSEIERRSLEEFNRGNYSEALRLIEEGIDAINQDILSAGAKGNAEEKKSPLTPASAVQARKDSPFGIHDPVVPELDNVEDVAAVGAKWVRYAGRNGITWEVIEHEKGKFNWDYHDRLYLRTFQSGIGMNVVILVFNRNDQSEFGYIPKNMNNYLNFLKKVVERYNGDGVDDAPGSPVVDVWEIENEPDFKYVVPEAAVGWKDSAANYALLLKKSYEVIKKTSPKAKVAFAGLTEPAGIDKYFIPALDVLERLKESKESKYFDIAGFHWAGFLQGDYKRVVSLNKTYSIGDSVHKMKEELMKRGYEDIPIWIGEMSYNDGMPAGQPLLKEPRTEKEQAIELFKRYIYSLSKGVDKIFWVSLTESHNWAGNGGIGYFDKVGLINNPRNGGRSHKKLAYYTYKHMTDVLEGSDWKRVQIINEEKGIYIFKFIKEGRPIWVVWNDNKGSQKIIVSGITSQQVSVSYAVPDVNSGDLVADYNSTFKPFFTSAQNGAVTLTVGAIPIIIES